MNENRSQLNLNNFYCHTVEKYFIIIILHHTAFHRQRWNFLFCNQRWNPKNIVFKQFPSKFYYNVDYTEQNTCQKDDDPFPKLKYVVLSQFIWIDVYIVNDSSQLSILTVWIIIYRSSRSSIIKISPIANCEIKQKIQIH